MILGVRSDLSEKIVLQGIVEGIIYQNEQNGYTVACLETKAEIVTVVGCLPFIRERDKLIVNGTWSFHSSYGQQLKVETFERLQPDNSAEMIEHLSSGLLKGIGPSKAKKLVKYFGMDVLKVIKNDPTRLSEVKGFTVEAGLRLSEDYCEIIEHEEVMMFLQKFGISPNVATKIYKELGAGSLDEIKRDPYLLALGDFGIDFKDADKIAAELSIEPENIHRIMSAVEFELTKAADNGHAFLPYNKLRVATFKLLEFKKEGSEYRKEDMETVENGIHALAGTGKVIEDVYEAFEGPDTRVYLNQFYEAERIASQDLLRIFGSVIPFNHKDISKMMDELEMSYHLKLDKKQKEALLQVADNGVVVITGGPGTGKTTIIHSLLSIFDKLGMKYLLAAPTGRASKRMSEATDAPACTIHRLLEVQYTLDNDKPIFNRNRSCPLETDVLIIDEMSMVDLLLMSNLLEAVKNGTRLILLGDVDQLPSVGAGNVLKDIITSGRISFVALSKVFRQAQESMIVVNAHKINRGEYPTLNMKDKDFFFIPADSYERVTEIVTDLCTRRLPEAFGYNSIRDIQVISPTRRGPSGIRALNVSLQEALNPKVQGVSQKEWNGVMYRVGDKIMQNKNNYDISWVKTSGTTSGGYEEGTGVFNGDMGTLIGIDVFASKVQVYFDDDREAWYDYEEMDELDLAYAVTVHKSQGCEFPVVVMPVCKVHNILMTRNLLYTAVTRARKLVILVGEEQWLAHMVNNNREMSRFSAMAERISSYWSRWHEEI